VKRLFVVIAVMAVAVPLGAAMAWFAAAMEKRRYE